ncbi:ABC transporter permease [Pollutimonas bauzanensis]|uniref:ABC transporter permease n=1 Tax=Pollutimonas bauzanensis TaxID=658167 RepID=UPI003342BA38
MSSLNRLWRNLAFRIGVIVLGLLTIIAIAAPYLGTVDPAVLDYALINRPAGEEVTFTLPSGSVAHTLWMGSDAYGRDIYSRVIYGTRISLWVAICVAVIAVSVGMLLGVAAGFFRRVDSLIMRTMDGLMAFPSILLAIALVAALGADLWTVVIAVAVPEIPRVVRLVRSMVLTLREEPFVEAAIALATPTSKILRKHILPNAIAPLIVQGTFIAASAVLTEAALSFLGLGLPTDIPTWGNIMAEGRVQFSQYPGNVMFPALFLVPTILAINLLGDGMRDALDPKFAKRTG